MICKSCGEDEKHYALGLCGICYKKQHHEANRTKHIVARRELRYENGGKPMSENKSCPLIEPVKNGNCIQTIRKGRKFSVGDSVLIHGWEGRPYRSKWSWRLRVEVQHIQNISINAYGIHRASHAIPLKWDSERVDEIAKNDFINPPTGMALKEVLFGLNGVPDKPEPYQIIGW